MNDTRHIRFLQVGWISLLLLLLLALMVTPVSANSSATQRSRATK